MTKTSIIFIFILFLNEYSFAQKDEIETLNFIAGVNGGVNLSEIRGNEIFYEMDKGKGILSGLYLEYFFSDMFSLHSEINYKENGMMQKREFFDNYGGSIGYYKEYFKYNYISTPITIRMSEGVKSKYFIDAGLYIAKLQSAITKANLPETFNQLEITKWYIDQTEITKKYDFGFVFDIGYDYIFLEKIHVLATLRYYYGVTKLNDYRIIYDMDIRNTSYSLTLGVGYTLDFQTNKKKTHKKRRKKRH